MASKPFLKWAGGKHKLTAFIGKNLPTAQRLIEPFAGSAALSLAWEYDAYLLNDANADLIAVYQILKTEKQEFIDYARTFFTLESNRENVFYELRERFNHSCDMTERAALFVYLNRHAFNGLCRYNSKGGFNVPFGRYKAPYFPEIEMQSFLCKAERMELLCGDFQAALNVAGVGDAVYCDPPYVPLSESASFTAYSAAGFDMLDQQRLASAVEQAAGQCAGVAVSNHDTPFTRNLYHNARLETIVVQRNIAAKGSSRGKVGELLAVYGG